MRGNFIKSDKTVLLKTAEIKQAASLKIATPPRFKCDFMIRKSGSNSVYVSREHCGFSDVLKSEQVHGQPF